MGHITFEPKFRAVGEDIDGCNRSPKEYLHHNLWGVVLRRKAANKRHLAFESTAVLSNHLGQSDLYLTVGMELAAVVTIETGASAAALYGQQLLLCLKFPL